MTDRPIRSTVAPHILALARIYEVTQITSCRRILLIHLITPTRGWRRLMGTALPYTMESHPLAEDAPWGHHYGEGTDSNKHKKGCPTFAEQPPYSKLTPNQNFQPRVAITLIFPRDSSVIGFSFSGIGKKSYNLSP